MEETKYNRLTSVVSGRRNSASEKKALPPIKTYSTYKKVNAAFTAGLSINTAAGLRILRR